MSGSGLGSKRRQRPEENLQELEEAIFGKKETSLLNKHLQLQGYTVHCCERLNGKLEELRGQIEPLQALRGQVEGLHGQLAPLQALRGQVAGLQGQIEPLQALRGQVDGLHGQIAQLQALSGQIERLEGQIAQHSIQINAQNTAHTSLNSDFRVYEEKVDKELKRLAQCSMGLDKQFSPEDGRVAAESRYMDVDERAEAGAGSSSAGAGAGSSSAGAGSSSSPTSSSSSSSAGAGAVAGTVPYNTHLMQTTNGGGKRKTRKSRKLRKLRKLKTLRRR